jgi:hypothetical protein
METIIDLGEKMPEGGEPLRHRVHDDNQRALREALDARVARIAGKMKPAQHKRVLAEHRKLWGILYRAKYNKLVENRNALHTQFIALGKTYEQAKTDKQREKIRRDAQKIAAQGKELNQRIEKLKPTYQRWKEAGLALDAHNRAVAYELEEKQNLEAFHNEARTWEEQIKAVLRRSPRLHHKGENKKGETFIKIPRIQQIDFKEDRVFFKIKTTYQSLLDKWRKTWSDALPYGVDVAALMSEDTVKNLEAATGRVVTAEYAKSGIGLYWVVHRPDSPDGIPARVQYGQVIDFYPRDEHKNTPFIAGVTTNRKLLYYTLQQNPHLLIAGTTNSGKSTFVNGLIATLITMNTPDEVRLVLIDNKGGLELQHFEGAQHNLMPMVREREDVLQCLASCRSMMQARFKLLASTKSQNLLDYNSMVTPETRLGRVVIVVDEMATLAGMSDTKSIQDELRIISSQGRAVGMHLILCTQNTNVAVIEGPVKTNMGMRISGKMPDLGSSMSIVGSAAAAHLPDGIPGRFVFSRGLTEAIVQTAYIGKDEIAKAVEIANQYPAPRSGRIDPQPEKRLELEIIDVQPQVKFSEDDLLALVVDKFELQIAASIIHPHLGNSTISRRKLEEMCKSIIERGKVSYRGVEYDIKKIRRSHYLRPITQPITRDKPDDDGDDERDDGDIAA